MSSLQFLNKKGFHPGTIANQEKVWMAEEKKKIEEKDMQNYLKERRKEREREEMAKMSGAPQSTHLEWMYQGGAPAKKAIPDEDGEAFLLGKKIDSTQDKSELKAAMTGSDVNQAWQRKVNSKNEIFHKMHEDPMFAIQLKRKKQMEEVLKNPLIMEKMRQKALAMNGNASVVDNNNNDNDDGALKKRKKKKKKKRRHRKHHQTDSKVEEPEKGFDEIEREPTRERSEDRSLSPEQKRYRSSRRHRSRSREEKHSHNHSSESSNKRRHHDSSGNIDEENRNRTRRSDRERSSSQHESRRRRRTERAESRTERRVSRSPTPPRAKQDRKRTRVQSTSPSPMRSSPHRSSHRSSHEESTRRHNRRSERRNRSPERDESERRVKRTERNRRDRSESPKRRVSRSPKRKVSRSPKRKVSRSPKRDVRSRSKSRSPKRRVSRSPKRNSRSRSRSRRRSRSRSRNNDVMIGEIGKSYGLSVGESTVRHKNPLELIPEDPREKKLEKQLEENKRLRIEAQKKMNERRKQRKRLTPEELEKKRQEMMSDGETFKNEKYDRMRRHAKLVKEDEDKHKAAAKGGAKFLDVMVKDSFDEGSLRDRVRSSRHRHHSRDDVSFLKR
eukprot:TRINITY_DN47_c0_g1_i3.p1 TRINITY_DN47_c0_g1~~TRINITY_DN47_c0_g1_i3.p1  ORF type:complete len:613 (-),score=199.06 TRINITY_DN47_c0_g1_i3:677-2515(-)